MGFGGFCSFWDFLTVFGLFGTPLGVLFPLVGLLLEIVKILRTSILKMDVWTQNLRFWGKIWTFWDFLSPLGPLRGSLRG